MLQAFKKFIIEHNLFTPDESILLAVSGGMDSVVMCELFKRGGYNFGIAHCHFNLRGEESLGDAAFVKVMAHKYDVPYYTRVFETKKVSEILGVSIQMAARKLRYEWFEEVRLQHNYKTIAVAHHKDDAVETLLINLSRGTGIAGLHGILKNSAANNIVRPLLFTGRKQIEEFIQANKLSFREDSSNQSTKYIRNKIRHLVIPVLKEINPQLENSIAATLERLGEVEQIYLDTVGIKRKEILVFENDRVILPIEKLKNLSPLRTYLFEFLDEYNFSQAVIEEIIHALDGVSGKQFFSATHRLLKDRDQLIITEITGVSEEIFSIEKNQEALTYPVKLSFSSQVLNKEDSAFINSLSGSGNRADSSRVSIDFDLLAFPLLLRKWKAGDTFQPLGMKNKKKLSDFFIDNKVSRIDKESSWVLTSAGNIVWIIGHRIDDRFKITDKTNSIYCLTLT